MFDAFRMDELIECDTQYGIFAIQIESSYDDNNAKCNVSQWGYSVNPVQLCYHLRNLSKKYCMVIKSNDIIHQRVIILKLVN